MSCIPGPQRVLRNRHQDPCTNGTEDTCPGCLPCPQDHCPTCQHRHHTNTCPTCLTVARTHLHTIRDLTGHLHHEAVNGRQALHTHQGIPGGDALVLASPGNYTTPHPTEELPNDPRPPLAVLTHWHDLWRHHTNQPTGLTPTLDRVTDYLDAQLHRIAETALFPALSRDLHRTLRQLEDVLHDGDRPETSKVPCWECGTRLVKEYADKASDDHWLCPRCGERYDRGRYDRAKHDHLASRGADRYVLLSDAAAAVGRPHRTLRTWITDGSVSSHRHTLTGRVFVWWPDVRSRHLSTPTRKRSRK